MLSYNSFLKFAFKIPNITYFLQKYTEVFKIPNISRQICKRLLFSLIFRELFVFLHRYRYKFFICQRYYPI